MYQLQYIKVKNIGTFQDLDYQFKNGQSQIIQGQNLDNKGQKNNGVGKSFFIDAIGFALTGLVLSGRSTDEFIRDNEDSAYIELYLKTKDDVRELLIKRYLHRKKSQLIEIFINGKPQHKDEHDVNSRNQFIINEIGISKEDLFQFFLISKDRYKAYFKLSDTDKKSITSRFSKADIIDSIFPKIEKDLSHEEIIRTNIERECVKLEAQIIGYESTLIDFEKQDSTEFKESIKKEFADKIEHYLSEIKQIEISTEQKKTEIFEDEKNISTIEQNILNIQKNIEEAFIELEQANKNLEKSENDLNNSISKHKKDIEQNDIKIRKKRIEIDKFTKDKNEVNEFIADINSKLKTSISCPACLHNFILESELTVDELKSSLEDLTDTLETINNVIITLKKDYDSLLESNEKISKIIEDTKKSYRSIIESKNQTINNLKKSIRLLELSEKEEENNLSKLKNKIDLDKISVESSQSKIEMFQKNILDCKKSIKDIDSSSNSDLIAKYKDLIKQTKDDFQLKKDELNYQHEKIRNINEWILKFKSFKSYLANLSLKNIQDLINFYLDKMNTDISVEIDGYKQQGKKIVEKITETILRNGIAVGSYNRFSGGEKARIDIGSILSNQTLINNNAAPRGLDLIIVDEVLESSDSLGIENIIKSMDSIDKTLILITQNEINSLPNQTMTFIKQNETTQIKYL